MVEFGACPAGATTLRSLKMEIARDNHCFRIYLDTVVIFPFHGAEFEERYGIVLRRYWEDGLGRALGRVVRLPFGRHFMLKELLDARVCRLFPEADELDQTSDALLNFLRTWGWRSKNAFGCSVRPPDTGVLEKTSRCPSEQTMFGSRHKLFNPASKSLQPRRRAQS
jgi:hypothetical protein